jgi:hypothetical protein
MATAPGATSRRRRIAAWVGRRTWAILLAAALVALPAAVLRVLCVGHACDRPGEAAAEVPFCSLPDELRRRVLTGFREGRSPDVLAVTGATPVVTSGVEWPSVGDDAARVPIVFAGEGVNPDASIPSGTGLDDVAPTLASVIGLRRPHPEVRSGEAVDGIASGGPARLVLEVVLAGVGSSDVQQPSAWPELHTLLEDGAGTLGADVGSVPLDPAAVLTTIGTGGLPNQHGITGSLVRNDAGKLVRAWGDGAPVSVIATLADDLDELNRQGPLIGLIGTRRADRGLIGGNWYVDVDRDDLVVVDEPRAQVSAALRLLRRGYGDDSETDLLAVVMHGRSRDADRALGRLVDLAKQASAGSVVVVVTSTGDAASTTEDAVSAGAVASQIETEVGEPEVIEGLAAGGLFLDQNVLASEEIPEDEVVSALLGLESGGRKLMADGFPAIAVSFARYC